MYPPPRHEEEIPKNILASLERPIEIKDAEKYFSLFLLSWTGRPPENKKRRIRETIYNKKVNLFKFY